MARQAVLDAFRDFTVKFEGDTNWMYLDVKGLVTTGIGNLIDPVGITLPLPWKNGDGSSASQDQIRSAWNTVKSRQDMAPRGGGAFQSLTSIRLSPEGVKQLVASKVLANEAVLRARFPALDTWPADAQLALYSMAWAAGPNFNAPKFVAAASRPIPDFATMAAESHFNTAGNPGLAPRNTANFELLNNAATIVKNGYDFAMLHWPVELPDVPQVVKTGAKGGLIAAAVGVAGFAGWKYATRNKRT